MLPPREFIKKIRPFSFLSSKELEILMSGLEVELIHKGKTIYTKGQARSYVYMIFSGLVGLFENDLPLDHFSKGEVFGIVSIRGKPYATTAKALEDTICYLIPADKFHDVLESNSRFSSFFASFVGRSFRSFKSIALDQQVPEEAVLVQEIDKIVYKDPVICGPGATVRDAVARMDQHGVSAIVIVDAEGQPEGIFTQKDLRRTVVSGDVMDAVSSHMSSPVKTMEPTETVFDALAGMVKAGINHMVVTRDGKLSGVITRDDIQVHLGPSSSITAFFSKIGKAVSVDELKHIYSNINKSVAKLASAGFSFYRLTRMITSVHDTLLTKVIEAQLGGAAADRFLWLNMGSAGRKEQVIATDQDSALVYRGEGEDWIGAAQEIVEVLAKIGIAKCRSGFMASTAQWNQSLSTWKDYFNTWFYDPVQDHVRYLSIFLDIRPGYGDPDLYRELTDWIRWHITAKAIRRLAYDAIMIEPPLGISGIVGLITGVDLKTFGIYPLVNGVRVLAIDNDMVQVTNTMERLEGLKARNVIGEDMCHDLLEAYAFMQDLRLKHHSRSVLDRNAVDNRIRVKELDKVDLLILKESLKIIASFQKFLMKKYDVKRADSYITSVLVGPPSAADQSS